MSCHISSACEDWRTYTKVLSPEKGGLSEFKFSTYSGFFGGLQKRFARPGTVFMVVVLAPYDSSGPEDFDATWS